MNAIETAHKIEKTKVEAIHVHRVKQHLNPPEQAKKQCTKSHLFYFHLRNSLSINELSQKFAFGARFLNLKKPCKFYLLAQVEKTYVEIRRDDLYRNGRGWRHWPWRLVLS